LNEITQGLIVSGLGLLITFASLGLLIGIITLLNKLFPYKEEAAEGEEESVEIVPVLESTTESGDEAELAAVISAALTAARSQSGSSLGASLMESRSPFWGARQVSSMTRNLQRK